VNKSAVEPMIWLALAATLLLWIHQHPPSSDDAFFGGIALILFVCGLTWRRAQKTKRAQIAVQHAESDARHATWLEERARARHDQTHGTHVAEQHAEYEARHATWLEERATARRVKALPIPHP